MEREQLREYKNVGRCVGIGPAKDFQTDWEPALPGMDAAQRPTP